MKKKLLELDGFRTIAIFLVLNFHFAIYIKFIPGYNELTGCGWVGVPLFFILSGFLLSAPFFQAALNGHEKPDIIKFYKKRILRIFPLYFSSLAIFTFLIIYFNGNSLNVKELILHFLFLNNFQDHHSLINAPYWSLAVEFQFYIIFPLFGLIIFNAIRRKRFIFFSLFIITGLLLPLAYRYITVFNADFGKKDYLQLIYISTFSNLDSFFFGIISAFFYFVKIKQTGYLINKKNLIVLLIISLLGIYSLMYYAYHNGGWEMNINYFAPGLFYTFLNFFWSITILTTLSLKVSYWNNILSSKMATYIATISFSLYIWHFWIFEVTKVTIKRFLPNSGFIINLIILVVAILFTFIISHMSYRFIERPFLKWKTKNE